MTKAIKALDPVTKPSPKHRKKRKLPTEAYVPKLHNGSHIKDQPAETTVWKLYQTFARRYVRRLPDASRDQIVAAFLEDCALDGRDVDYISGIILKDKPAPTGSIEHTIAQSLQRKVLSGKTLREAEYELVRELSDLVFTTAAQMAGEVPAKARMFLLK